MDTLSLDQEIRLLELDLLDTMEQYKDTLFSKVFLVHMYRMVKILHRLATKIEFTQEIDYH